MIQEYSTFGITKEHIEKHNLIQKELWFDRICYTVCGVLFIIGSIAVIYSVIQ